MAARYPALALNAASLRLHRPSGHRPQNRPPLSIAANFNFAFLAWASRFVDVSISAILFGTWPIFLVIIHDRLYQHRDRYHRLFSSNPAAPRRSAWPVFAFIIVGQAGGFANVETAGLAELVIGVVLAVIGAIATACNAFGFHWGTDLADDFPDETRQALSHESLEFFGLLVAFLIANAVSGLFNTIAGVSSGEVMDSRSLLIAVVVGGGASGIANAAWRKANLDAHHAGVNALAFAAPGIQPGLAFLPGTGGATKLGLPNHRHYGHRHRQPAHQLRGGHPI